MRAAPAPRASLVGRRTELGQFSTSLQACLDCGTGLTIHVRGDPGIGKTRLVEAFRDLAQKRGFACHIGHVLDFGLGAERDPMRSLVHGLLGVGSGEPEAGRTAVGDADRGRAAIGAAESERSAIGAAVASGLIAPAQEVHLLDLLQLPMPPALRSAFDAMDDATRQCGQRELLETLLLRCSARQPRLLVLEDLHWAEARTLAQAAVLAAAAERCAALLVTTARSDGDPLNAAWRTAAGVSALVTLDLGPLRWAEANALAAQLGAADQAFTLRCVERSGGNPLFLEHLLQASRDADSALPGSVQSVVQARLDGLDEGARHQVRVASVLGQRFPLEALNHLLGAAPGFVPRFAHGLLRCQGGERGEGVFAHALVHESTYASLPRAQRRELHARAARWFAGRDPILHAEHLDRAEQPGAAQAYLEAAQLEAAAHRHERALRLAERGLALAGEDGPRFALACCRADVLHDLGAMPEAQAGYEAALAVAADDAARCRACLGIAAVLRVRDDLDGAAAALAQAERAAKARGLVEQRSRIHLLRGNLLFPRGDLAGCQREHEQSLALARKAGSVELETAALGGLGDAAYLRGLMLTARERFEGCVALAQRHGLKRVEAANRPMAAIACWYGGDGHKALVDARTAIEVAAQIGHRRGETIGHHGAYQFSHALMDFDAALRHAERALELARQLAGPAGARARRSSAGAGDRPRHRDELHGSDHSRHARACRGRPGCTPRGACRGRGAARRQRPGAQPPAVPTRCDRRVSGGWRSGRRTAPRRRTSGAYGGRAAALERIPHCARPCIGCARHGCAARGSEGGVDATARRRAEPGTAR